MKSFTRRLIALASIFLMNSCEGDSKPPEWSRFEKALLSTTLMHRDTLVRQFILWNDAACHGCKVKCVNLLLQHPEWHIRVIAPYGDRVLASQLPPYQYWVDSFNHIGRYFYGVNNVGLIRLKGNRVEDIRDFSVPAMDSLQAAIEFR